MIYDFPLAAISCASDQETTVSQSVSQSVSHKNITIRPEPQSGHISTPRVSKTHSRISGRYPVYPKCLS
jgi:hypothetical protein